MRREGDAMTDIIERLRAGVNGKDDLVLTAESCEAADEIERLRQGRETMGNLWAREQEARHAAEAEIERLRAALEPFAKEADRYEPNEGDDDVRAWGSSFPICYLRRARDALESASERPGNK
jgi:hypothetical protein